MLIKSRGEISKMTGELIRLRLEELFPMDTQEARIERGRLHDELDARAAGRGHSVPVVIS